VSFALLPEELSVIRPLQESLALIAPHLPHQLVSPQVFSHIKSLACWLPNAMSSYYLECRLADDKTQVDFLTCATAFHAGREILSGQGSPALPAALLENPLWRRIRDFYTHWADPTSPLYEQVPLTWLEFDHVDCPPLGIPLPCFSFCLDREYVWWKYAQPRRVNHLSAGTYRQVAEMAFSLLRGHPLSPQAAQNLFACFDLLPAGGQIIHLSAMLTRHPPSLKVYGSLPKEHFCEYLTRIGWPGELAAIKTFLSEFYTAATADDTVFFDLTLDNAVASKLGIAFSQQQIEQFPRKDPGRRALLDHCVERGLCTPEKREALCSWPGSFRGTFRGHSRPTRFQKWLDIKIVYQPHHPLEAKGYLGFMPVFSLF
jgi:hypothetical protein